MSEEGLNLEEKVNLMRVQGQLNVQWGNEVLGVLSLLASHIVRVETKCTVLQNRLDRIEGVRKVPRIIKDEREPLS